MWSFNKLLIMVLSFLIVTPNSYGEELIKIKDSIKNNLKVINEKL